MVAGDQRRVGQSDLEVATGEHRSKRRDHQFSNSVIGCRVHGGSFDPGGDPRRSRDRRKGSVEAVRRYNGTILWKTYTTVAGYTGVRVWGSNPVVDPLRGLLYIGTGDNYSTPTDPAYLSCISAGGTAATCQSPDNHVDSMLAINIFTGKIVWSQKMVTWNQYGVTSGSDFFNLACAYRVTWLPEPDRAGLRFWFCSE